MHPHRSDKKGSWWQYITHMTIEKKVMTKKGHQIFGHEKCTPSLSPLKENAGYAYAWHSICLNKRRLSSHRGDGLQTVQTIIRWTTKSETCCRDESIPCQDTQCRFDHFKQRLNCRRAASLPRQNHQASCSTAYTCVPGNGAHFQAHAILWWKLSQYWKLLQFYGTNV